MDIEHELRAMDQARLTTDGIHFDSIEGQAWLNRVFQERLDELEVELFDTGVLKEEGASNEPTKATFVPPSLETRLGAVPAVTIYKPQSSSEPGHRTDVRDRLGEAPMRRTINPRRRLGPVNSTAETTSTSRPALPSKNTMGPVNARPLQDVKRFLITRAPIGQHVKMFRQLKTPPGHLKEKVYPKQMNQEGDVQRYGGLKAIKKDGTIFAAYDKAEMRKAKIMIVANSDFVHTSKSLFWPDVIMERSIWI